MTPFQRLLSTAFDRLPEPGSDVSVTVGLYLADRADRLATATLQRRLAATRAAHREGGWSLDTADPAVRAVWQGIRRVALGNAVHLQRDGLGLLAVATGPWGQAPAGTRSRVRSGIPSVWSARP
jgi:hypothetical protein